MDTFCGKSIWGLRVHNNRTAKQMGGRNRKGKRKKSSDTDPIETKTPKHGGQNGRQDGRDEASVSESESVSVSESIRQANSVLFNQSLSDMNSSVFCVDSANNGSMEKSVTKPESQEPSSPGIVIIEYLKRYDKKIDYIDKRLDKLDSLEKKISSFEQELKALKIHVYENMKITEEKVTKVQDRVDSMDF